MIRKLIAMEDAAAKIGDGATIMVGGFMGCGNAHHLIDAIVARKLSPAETAAQMSEEELISFLFLPGFSMRDKVTQISGRGVGLDAVQPHLYPLPRQGTADIQGAAVQLANPIPLVGQGGDGDILRMGQGGGG